MKLETLLHKKLFIFDLDGTVTDSEPCHRESYDVTLKEICSSGMEHDEFLKNYVGHSESDIYRIMREKKHIEFDDGDFFTRRIDNLCKIIENKRLTTAPFYRQLEKMFPDARFVALTSQRPYVLEKFRKTVDYGKMAEFISVADKPFNKRDVLSDTEKYLGYKNTDCIIFEDYNVTLRAAVEFGIYAVGVRHTLNSLTPDDCDEIIDIDKEITFI